MANHWPHGGFEGTGQEDLLILQLMNYAEFYPMAELGKGDSERLDTNLSSLEMGNREMRQQQGWKRLIKGPEWASGQVCISFSCSLKARLLFTYLTLENIQMYLSFKGVNLFLERTVLRADS